jgi:CRISPR-associated protein Csd1
MILQALYDYYQRKPEIHAPIGYELEEIDFLIVIDKNGKLINLKNQRENNKGHQYFIPKAVVRSGKKILPNLLWDNFEYITGLSKDSKRIVKAKNYNRAFVNKINSLSDSVKDEAVEALLKFYNSNFQDQFKKHPNFEECLKQNGWMTFQLEGDYEIIPDKEIIKEYQAEEFLSGKYEEDDIKNVKKGACLITGDKKIIKRLHTELRLPGSDKNVKIVAIQEKQGYDSYNKERGYNAPVSIEAESNYSAALKHLLNSKTNKIKIADTTILFWAEKKTEEINPEEMFSFLVSQKPDEDNPDKGIQVIESFINSVFTGQLSSEKTNHFYVLGLAPNAARISVRFWKAPSVEDFGRNIEKHFEDFEIIHRDYQSKYLSIYEILSSISLETKKRDKPNVIFFRGKYYDVIPNLAGEFIEAIIDGSLFPFTLLQQCIIRIRAEASKKDKNGKVIPNVSHPRAAILKACLNRNFRIQNSTNKEINMSLDKTNNNVGYLLGRLFAIIERAQFVSNGYKEPNAGVRDRFWGSFSSSPISVLPIIEKLYGHHFKKIKNTRKFFEANLLEENKKEIVDKLEPFQIPAHLSLDQQALFSVGYYHQKSEIEKFRSTKKDIQSNNN